MDSAVGGFVIGVLLSAAAFGAGLGTFLTTKSLTSLAEKLVKRMEERVQTEDVISSAE